jgi:DNA-binding MurR/RpiR family transcriptional regulator
MVADYILQHMDSVPFCTLGDLADKIGVSTTTVIRFARSNGCEGYSEMQAVLQDELRRKVSLPSRLDSIHAIPKDELLSHTMHNDISNIQRTMSSLSQDTLNDAVAAIAGAQNVYVLGMRTSYALAYYTSICLGQIRSNVRLVQANGLIYPEEVLGASAGDVCVAFLFPRYSKVTKTILEWMREQQVKVVLVTSTNCGAVEYLADWLIPCSVSGVSLKNSYAAPMCVINYLFASLTQNNREQTADMLKKAERLIRDNLGLN